MDVLVAVGVLVEETAGVTVGVMVVVEVGEDVEVGGVPVTVGVVVGELVRVTVPVGEGVTVTVVVAVFEPFKLACGNVVLSQMKIRKRLRWIK